MKDKSAVFKENLAEFRAVAQEISTLQQKKSVYTRRNQVIQLCILFEEASPDIIARRFKEKYGKSSGMDLNALGVKRLLASSGLGNVVERKNLSSQAKVTAGKLEKLTRGEKVTGLRNILMDSTYDKSSLYKFMVLLYLLELMRSSLDGETCAGLMRLDVAFAADFIDTYIARLQEKADSGVSTDAFAALKKENEALKADLDRKRRLLINLQQNFDARLEESRLEQQADLISRLNSDEYGHILDLLVSAQNGFNELRDKGTAIPKEIRSMRTLVRKLQKFVSDAGVTPMMETGRKLKVKIADMDHFEFEGSPFADDKDVKRVVIISSGWQIADRDVIISYPRLSEIEE